MWRYVLILVFLIGEPYKYLPAVTWKPAFTNATTNPVTRAPTWTSNSNAEITQLYPLVIYGPILGPAWIKVGGEVTCRAASRARWLNQPSSPAMLFSQSSCLVHDPHEHARQSYHPRRNLRRRSSRRRRNSLTSPQETAIYNTYRCCRSYTCSCTVQCALHFHHQAVSAADHG